MLTVVLDSGTNTAVTVKEKFKPERYLLLFTRCYCSCLSSVDINFFEVTQTNYHFFSRFTSLPQTEGFWKACKDPRYKGTYSYCLIRHSEVIKIISIKCFYLSILHILRLLWRDSIRAAYFPFQYFSELLWNTKNISNLKLTFIFCKSIAKLYRV